ncbi:MAG: glutamate synthase (NADPH/NADH) small chain [Flavobacteriales bacterium]|jgi:glutamate synthase (NADPH/NADH) small chain
MGKVTGFLEYTREVESYDAPSERLKHYKEFTVPLKTEALQEQGGRCMDCGVPFCHSGCPLGNLVPDFNDMVYRGRWKQAAKLLHSTNNFPEFTGRLCPAPCEEACVLGINEDPVTIENIEKNIVEKGFSEGWIVPEPPVKRTGKKIAIIGSGPSGLAAAQQLNRAGHWVTVFEKEAKIGGLLRYGIPDFKLEKNIIDRRLEVLEAEGIIFQPNTEVGVSVSVATLQETFDALVLCGGAAQKRSIPVQGVKLNGVHQAMDFLKQSNQKVAGVTDFTQDIDAGLKKVIVIGGGDTGSDCIGTSNRQGAESVINFEILNKPTIERPQDQPWPYWPMRLRESSSHQEGVDRVFNISTKEFIGDDKGNLIGLKTAEVAWVKVEGKHRPTLKEIPGTEKIWDCDMVLLALGFTGPEKTLIDQLGLKTDLRGNVKSDAKYRTSVSTVFAAGDMRRGQSLIVWAIAEGRQAAHHVDAFLMGKSVLPLKDEESDLPRVG